MTEDFMAWDQQDATELYGIGKYGSDSYEIFFQQNYSVQPTDKELRRYLDQEVPSTAVNLQSRKEVYEQHSDFA
jgi:hypothetical protein